MSVLGLALLASPAATPGTRTPAQADPKVQIVVLDDATVKPLVKARVGQLLLVSIKTLTDDPDVMLDVQAYAEVCIAAAIPKCHPAEEITDVEIPAQSWSVRVEPGMVAKHRLSLYVTFKGTTIAQRAFPAATLPTGPPKVQWSKGVGLESISTCFARGDLPPGFSAQIQVKHWWIGHPKAETHAYRFSFKPPTRFRAVKYRGVTSYTSVFDEDCLDIIPLLAGIGERVGYFTFTYIYKNRKVSSASYKYVISRTAFHHAKQGSDEFFNYCLKQHPETISSVGGVLQCPVPGDTLVAHRRI
jgi:hypothetical protein